MALVYWGIGYRHSKGSQDHRMLYIVFFRISNIGYHSGCSELVLTQTALVMGNFKYLGFVVKIEMLQPDPAQLWEESEQTPAAVRSFRVCVSSREPLSPSQSHFPLLWLEEPKVKSPGHLSPSGSTLMACTGLDFVRFPLQSDFSLLREVPIPNKPLESQIPPQCVLHDFMK